MNIFKEYKDGLKTYSKTYSKDTIFLANFMLNIFLATLAALLVLTAGVLYSLKSNIFDFAYFFIAGLIFEYIRRLFQEIYKEFEEEFK